MKPQAISILLCLLTLVLPSRAADRVIYEGTSGPGVGKQIVFLTGDEEYRSEEGLPQMAKILATRHGFKCTVLFAINPADGTINPDIRNSLPGAEALDTADVIFMLNRFREWPDAIMKHFVDAYLAGKPIIALRTSTHAFSYGRNSSSALHDTVGIAQNGKAALVVRFSARLGYHITATIKSKRHEESSKRPPRRI